MNTSYRALSLWFSQVSMKWDIFETFSRSALVECAYSPSWLLWTPGENKRVITKWHWFEEEKEDGWNWQLQEKWCGPRQGKCQARKEDGGLMGWCHWTRGAWVGSAHLDTPFGPQMIGCLYLFVLGIRSQLFHSGTRALWSLIVLNHFEDLFCSRNPEHPSICSHTLMLYEVSNSLHQRVVALGEPWYRKAPSWHIWAGWGAIQMFW